MNNSLRAVFGLFAALFVFAAVVQYNDPDPARWIVMYLVAAAVCGIGVWRPLPRGLTGAYALLTFVWGATLFSASAAQDFSMDAEEPREMFGLFIVSVVMGLLAFKRGPR